MKAVMTAIDHLSNLLSLAGRLVILALVSSMFYEVMARYVFNAPTLWAFDISYMLNGSIFLLGSAYALREEAHIRIDFLSQKFPNKIQRLINGLFYLIIMCPLVGLFAWTASSKAWRAWVTGELESVSPWAPHVWPFYSVIALGLAVFALQFAVEGIKYLSGEKHPGEHSDGTISDVLPTDATRATSSAKEG